MVFELEFVGVVGNYAGCDDGLVTPQRPSDVFFTHWVQECYMSWNGYILFLKISEKSESHSFPIDRRLVLLKFGYTWDCVDVGGNVERGKCLEHVGWTTKLSGRWTWVPVVVGCIF